MNASVPSHCSTEACYKRLKGALKILKAKQRVAEEKAKTASVQKKNSVNRTVDTFKAAAVAMKKITEKARIKVKNMAAEKQAAIDAANAKSKVS